MFISFNTEELTDVDKAVLRAVVGDGGIQAVAAQLAQGVKTTPAKKAAPASGVAQVEPEEDLVGEEATMEQAVARATELVSAGKAANVKAALASADVKRVSELADSASIAKFLAELADADA